MGYTKQRQAKRSLLVHSITDIIHERLVIFSLLHEFSSKVRLASPLRVGDSCKRSIEKTKILARVHVLVSLALVPVLITATAGHLPFASLQTALPMTRCFFLTGHCGPEGMVAYGSANTSMRHRRSLAWVTMQTTKVISVGNGLS